MMYFGLVGIAILMLVNGFEVGFFCFGIIGGGAGGASNGTDGGAGNGTGGGTGNGMGGGAGNGTGSDIVGVDAGGTGGGARELPETELRD